MKAIAVVRHQFQGLLEGTRDHSSLLLNWIVFILSYYWIHVKWKCCVYIRVLCWNDVNERKPTCCRLVRAVQWNVERRSKGKCICSLAFYAQQEREGRVWWIDWLGHMYSWERVDYRDDAPHKIFDGLTVCCLRRVTCLSAYFIPQWLKFVTNVYPYVCPLTLPQIVF